MAKPPVTMPHTYKIAEGLFFGKVYWILGDMPSAARQRNDVKDPPTSGWSHCFLIDKGGTMVTLFCPYALESFQVSRTCSEVVSMSMDDRYEPAPMRPGDKHRTNIRVGWLQWTDERQEKLLAILKRNWDMHGNLKTVGKDFDTAAMVLHMMGADVPLRTIAEGAEPDKARGGKEADVLGLLKPVKPNSVRGKVLSFFLPQARSVREAMAEFGYSRSNVLSHLYMLTKEHGIGYVLSGDSATILLPEGCTDPFVADT